MTIRVLKVQFNSVSSANNPAGWEDGGAGNSTGLKFSDGGGFGISCNVISAFTGASTSSGRTNADNYGIPEAVWERYWTISTGTPGAVEFGGFIANQPIQVEFFGAGTATGRHRLMTFDGTQFQNDEPGGTEPVTPSEPTVATGNVDSSGVATLSFSSASSTTVYAGVIITWDDAWAPEPTDPEITDDSTDLIIQNGETQTISFIRTVSDPVSLAIIYDDTVNDPIVVSQADFTLLGDVEDGAVSATFVATIGAMPYTDAGTYEPAHYRYVATCADDSEIELAGVTVLPQPGRAFVTAVDPVSDETGILYQWESGGAVTGDQVEWQSDQVTVREDFTFFGPAGTSDVTLNINYWDSVGATWYAVEVIVSFGDDGEGTVIGMTSAGFTVEGFTVRGFTARGF